MDRGTRVCEQAYESLFSLCQCVLKALGCSDECARNLWLLARPVALDDSGPVLKVGPQISMNVQQQRDKAA